jgi:hypothetical protein
MLHKTVVNIISYHHVLEAIDLLNTKKKSDVIFDQIKLNTSISNNDIKTVSQTKDLGVIVGG